MMRLVTEEMELLWKRATGALLHGPRCSCMGPGIMHRNRSDLERDIAEFLIAKYEDRGNASLVRLIQAWVDEDRVASARGGMQAGMHEGLPEWIDRRAPSMNLSNDDLGQIAADIRELLQSMVAPAGQFVCR